jgi:alpha-1,2-glucosyltransferase
MQTIVQRLTWLSVYIAVLIAQLALVNRIVPEPYMDEIFHVPQTQQWCAGNWSSWDPKITTLPGLYVLV